MQPRSWPSSQIHIVSGRSVSSGRTPDRSHHAHQRRVDLGSATGGIRRTARPPLTRGLNRNFNRLLKKIFKTAAHDVTGRPGELQQWHERTVDRGMHPEMAYLTIGRKIAAIVLTVWK